MKEELNKRVYILLFISFGALVTFGQQRLTPYGCYAHTESAYHQKYVSKCYEKLLPIEPFQFAYMVLPSFENEYALSRLRNMDELVLTKSQGSIWMCSKYRKGCPIKAKTYSLSVPNSILDSINALFKAAVLSSSYVDYTLGCDGVTYMFMGGVNGEFSVIMAVKSPVGEPRPLKVGRTNDSYVVPALQEGVPSYFLQKINHHVFTDVEALQRNIAVVTEHIRGKLLAAGVADVG